MEASSVVLQRPNPCFARVDARIDAQFHSNSYYCNHSKKLCTMMTGMGFCSSSLIRTTGGRRKRFDFGFYDKGQMDYYSYFDNKSSPGGVKKEKIKYNEKEEKKTIRKRLKLLKALSKDLNIFSEIMGFDNLEPDQVKAKTMADAAEVLIGHLEKLRAEEKELKRKRKEEKALLRAAAKSHKQQQKQVGPDNSSSSSSSSSESSDSECDEEVVNMNLFKGDSIAKPVSNSNQPDIEKETSNISSLETLKLTTLPGSLLVQEVKNDDQVRSCISNSVEQQERCCSSETSKCYNSVDSVCLNEEEARKSSSLPEKKIEVCMGGKCKKSGAASLLQEFQKVVGLDVAVSGCKCMGKCKNGPNVRILNNSIDGEMQGDRRSPANPLCIGVGLEDVSLIVANLFRDSQNEVGSAAAAAAP